MNGHQTRAIVRIREMILRGELGPGERVAEAPLAELLGMSRTPVRQALPVLAQEGLLTEHQTRGYVVRGFSTADVLDAIDLRGVLEGLAARRVAERGASRTLLQALRSEEHTSELQSQSNLVCRLLLEKKQIKPSEHVNNISQILLTSLGGAFDVFRRLESAADNFDFTPSEDDSL